MRKYVAERCPGGVELHVQLHDEGGWEELANEPPGFEWGYQGAGPRTLARVILTHFIVERFAEDFMREIVATTPSFEWPGPQRHRVMVLPEDRIVAWLIQKLRELQSA